MLYFLHAPDRADDTSNDREEIYVVYMEEEGCVKS